MAELTDEDKAALIAGTDAQDASDASKPTNESDPSAEGDQLQDDDSEPEKPAEEEPVLPDDDQPQSFTKQFPNLKGESWDEYGPNLEQAYDNSFKEGLRLQKELDEARKVIANLPAIQEAGTSKNGTSQDATSDFTQLPEIQYIKAIQQRDMRSAFDTFAEAYPQVRETDNFTKFRDAATPIGQVFMATEGREPTYDELFPRIAQYFGWQPAEEDGRRGQALKENLSTGGMSAGPSKPPARGPKVSEAQVDAYLKMFPAKNRADAVKELQEALV